MTDKVTLTNLANLQNDTTATTAINANNAAITTAINNTISRDGTSSNQMNAALDMNSNRIANLPAPISDSEPLRLVDAASLTGGSISLNPLPTGGTTSQILKKTSNTNYDVAWANIGSVENPNVVSFYTNVGSAGSQFGYTTAASTWAAGTVTPFGRSVLATTSADSLSPTISNAYGSFSVNRAGSSQLITYQVFTKLQLNTETFDSDSVFDNVTNYRYQPLKAGRYYINLRAAASASGLAGAADATVAAIYKNGSILSSGTYVKTTAATGTWSLASTYVSMNGTTDFIEAYIYAPSGSANGPTTDLAMFGWRVTP